MVRVIINGVSFYTTMSRIKSGTVSDDSNINAAIAAAHSSMVKTKAIGLATTVRVYDSKLACKDIQVQIN